MTWRSTAVYWALFVVLCGFYATVEQRPEPPSEAKLARKKVVDVYAEDVTALLLRGRGREIRCEKQEKRWAVVKPAGVRAAPDLIAALVENLTERQEAEEMDAAPSPEVLQAYGLTEGALEVGLELAGEQRVIIKLGARNPPQTAVYAQSSLTPRVLLVGLNVQYYTDLLFEAASRPPAQAAVPPKAKNRQKGFER